MQVKCKKSLRKSTYRRLAFKMGRKYELLELEKALDDGLQIIWVLDELGNPFSFSCGPVKGLMYQYEDYFVGG